MIYAAVALAAITAAAAAQDAKPPAPSEKPVYGRVIEVTPSKPKTGLQPGPCGMPIIPADPSVDPKFVITTPESERREAKIRTAEPPKCEPMTLVPAKKR